MAEIDSLDIELRLDKESVEIPEVQVPSPPSYLIETAIFVCICHVVNRSKQMFQCRSFSNVQSDIDVFTIYVTIVI